MKKTALEHGWGPLLPGTKVAATGRLADVLFAYLESVAKLIRNGPTGGLFRSWTGDELKLKGNYDNLGTDRKSAEITIILDSGNLSLTARASTGEHNSWSGDFILGHSPYKIGQDIEDYLFP